METPNSVWNCCWIQFMCEESVDELGVGQDDGNSSWWSYLHRPQWRVEIPMCVVLTAFRMAKVAEPCIQWWAIQHLVKGWVVIFRGWNWPSVLYNRYAAALWAAENEHKYFISFTSLIAFCTAEHFYFCLAQAKLMKLLRHCFNNQLSFLLGNPLHLSAIQHSYVQ